MIKNKRAINCIKILIILIILVIILIGSYFTFLIISSTKKNTEVNQTNTGNNEFISREPLIINPAKNMLAEKGCIPGSVLILENIKFFQEPKNFIIINKEPYENKEVCYIRNHEGKQYYITLDGEKMFEIKIENGQRTVNPVLNLVNYTKP